MTRRQKMISYSIFGPLAAIIALMLLVGWPFLNQPPVIDPLPEVAPPVLTPAGEGTRQHVVGGGGGRIDWNAAFPFTRGGGCAPCGEDGGGGVCSLGGGGLMQLDITRIHSMRNVHFVGSFGPGVFSNYDYRVVAYSVENEMFEEELFIDTFEPHDTFPRRFSEADSDGVLTNELTKSIKQARMLNSSGSPPELSAKGRRSRSPPGTATSSSLNCGRTPRETRMAASPRSRTVTAMGLR